MASRRLLVTGSGGLIGSEVVEGFAAEGWEVHGLENNQRADFFGPQGDTRWNVDRLRREQPRYQHHSIDIRNRPGVMDLFREVVPHAVVHTAAQPSHDLAASRPFGLPTCCLRGGCLTGPNHTGVELHGFLSYLIRCNLEGRTYRIFGYKGKQVRDNIHSRDVVQFMLRFVASPRVAEVYNLGGGRANSVSILEAFDLIAAISGKPMQSEYVDQPRQGDHQCYLSDLTKMKAHYSGWTITKDIPTTFQEIYQSWRKRAPDRAG